MDFKQTLQPFPLLIIHKACRAFPSDLSRVHCLNPNRSLYEYDLGELEQARGSAGKSFNLVKQRIEDLWLKNLGLRRLSPTDPEELVTTESEGIGVEIPVALVNHPQQSRCSPEYAPDLSGHAGRKPWIARL